MADCIFCKIASGEMNTDLVYEDDKVVAFEDVNAQAPTHLLIVPKKHVPTLLDLQEDDYSLVAHIYKVANELAEQQGIAEDGFRIVANCKDDGGQTVYHIHFHLLGGRMLQWPPG
ncbi:MAG: histidine triad nucleotide-binding protein [Bacillota bacterium]